MGRYQFMEVIILMFNSSERKESLLYKEFVPYTHTIALGNKIRVNHDTDSCRGESKSMLIHKHRTGVITAYCYRCGKFGKFSKDKEVNLPSRITGKWCTNVIFDQVGDQDLKLPRDTQFFVKDWPVQAKTYFKKARMTTEQCEFWRMGYSPSLRKVVIPVYRNGVLIGYQLRRIFDEDPSPKYITRRTTKEFYKLFPKTGNTCVLVEDMLSAIRVSKFTTALCMFGTEVSHAMVKLLAGYSNVIIFLDNDNAIVKKKQMDIQNKLELWVPNVLILRSPKQPKDYTDTDLQTILDFKA